MAEERQACSEACAKDWASNRRTFVVLWGLPGAAMSFAVLLEPALRAVVWIVTLIWMGGVCLANARRCGRTHCRFTGPFFLVMAALVVAYAIGGLQLGSQGWAILGGVTVIGNALIWWGSERLLGVFRRIA